MKIFNNTYFQTRQIKNVCIGMCGSKFVYRGRNENLNLYFHFPSSYHCWVFSLFES